MVPTSRAERLGPRLRATVMSLEALLKDEVGEPATILTIAMRDQFVLTLGAPLLQALGTERQLKIVAYDRERVHDDLTRGALDLAIAVDPPDQSGLVQKVLYRETFVCLTPTRRPPSLGAYLDARHVVTSAHAGYVGIDAALAKLGYARTVAAYVPYFAAAVRLADEAGLFVTLPRRVALAMPRQRLHLHAVPIPIPGFTVRMVWDRRVDRDPRHQRLREMIEQAAPSPRPSGSGTPGGPRASGR